MAENGTPFSTRTTVAAGGVETILQPLIISGPGKAPSLFHVCIEPDAANVTSVEVGFLETTTNSFMPRFETTSALGRRDYPNVRQTGPRGSSVAVRLVAAAAASVRILYDGEVVSG